MKKNCLYLFFCCCIILFSSCSSIKKIGTNAVSDMLAGSDKNGKVIEKKSGESDPMLAVMGESDTILISDFFPTALKLYEIMQAGNPSHQGLSIMTASLNVMYANAFVQSSADQLGVESYDKKNSEYQRAEMHYLRGRDMILSVFDQKYKNFSENLLSGDEEKISEAIKNLKKADVNAVYWFAAGALGAFSLNPINPEYLMALNGVLASLEKASELDGEYSNGAIWGLLFSFYVAAPVDFGGDMERGMECFENAQRISQGKQAGNYVSYAEIYCIAQNDEEGFVDALEKALAINPEDDPSTKLMTIIYQEKAKRLLDSREDYFIHW